MHRLPGDAKGPTLPVCHLCGRQFGSNSIGIHLKSCAERYERERGRPAPPAPDLSDNGSGEAENAAAYDAWANDLEPCPHCSRKFLPDRLEVHMCGCNKGATDAAGAHGGSSGGGSSGGGSEESSRSVSKKKPSGGGKKGGSGGGGSGGKKVLPVCYLCGREFGTASLAIHVKECKKRYEREHGKPAPEAPDIPGLGGGGGTEDRVIMPSAKDWEAYNEQAWASAQAQLSPCELCGRTFQSDRLPVHKRGCSGPKKAAKDKAELTDAERKTADAVVGKMQDAVKENAPEPESSPEPLA